MKSFILREKFRIAALGYIAAVGLFVASFGSKASNYNIPETADVQPTTDMQLVFNSAAADGGYKEASAWEDRQDYYLGNKSNRTRYQAWLSQMDDAKELPLLDKADRVNDFVNNTVTYATDSINYGRGDYWASGVETICKGEGDCEDFALAKFYALKYLNVPENRMFLLWISDTVAHDGHMVLGVDTSAVNNWTNCLILDNYEGTANSLKTLGQTDYAPFLVDAVNSQEILGCKAKILKPPAP